ncbi:hypothetical protein Hanom_Chr14g01278171 [Helianthus anomalus]
MLLTDGESVQRAKHEEPKQSVPAILFVVSKHSVGSFLIAVKPAVAGADYQQISAVNRCRNSSQHHQHCLPLLSSDSRP